MTQSDASRIQSTQASTLVWYLMLKIAEVLDWQTKAGHDVGKNSFASRAQSAAATNANKGNNGLSK